MNRKKQQLKTEFIMVFVHTVKCIFVIYSVMYVDITLYKYRESNVIGYNRNRISTTVVYSQYVMRQCNRPCTEQLLVTCRYMCCTGDESAHHFLQCNIQFPNILELLNLIIEYFPNIFKNCNQSWLLLGLYFRFMEVQLLQISKELTSHQIK